MRRPEYDWQIGEEKWQANPPGEDRQVNRPAQDNVTLGEDAVRSGRSHRRAALIVFAVVGLVAATVSLFVLGRANEVTVSITQDVLAAHEVVQRAIAHSDTDLFDMLVLQSGGYGGWHAAQRDLVQRAILLDRRPFGLHLQAADPQVVQVNLSPDLKEAGVVTEYAYTTLTGPGITETVRLRHTAIYRFDGQRWLLVPPGGDDFWGDSVTREGEFLTLAYPQRDAPIGERLAGDLDAALAQLCADSAGIGCSAGFHVQLHLSKASDRLAELLTGGVFAFQSSTTTPVVIEMPTPTLVGLPVDEAGYQALYRGYAIQVAHTVFSIATREQTSGSRFVSPVVLDKRLIEIGIRAWPPVAVDDAPRAAPLPLPDQGIAVFCVEGLEGEGTLDRYAPSTGARLQELSNRVVVSMEASPDHDGVVLQEHAAAGDEARSRISLWRNGEDTVLFEGPASSGLVSYSPLIRPPTGHVLIATYRDNQNPAVEDPTYTLIDLTSCTASGCASKAIPLPGYPVWSPDGTQLLAWDADHNTLFHGDAEGQSLTELGDGLYPFWLDNQNYGYIHWGGSPAAVELEVVTAAGRDDKTRVMLRGTDLQAALPESERSDWSIVGIGPVTISPTNPDVLLIAAYATHERLQPNWPGRSYVFLFDRRSGVTSLRLQSDLGSWFNFTDFSPDGRWFITSSSDFARFERLFILHDISRRETRTLTSLSLPGYPLAFPEYKWSSDGQWLLILDDGVLRLIAPAFDYERTIVPESPGCMFAAWVN